MSKEIRGNDPNGAPAPRDEELLTPQGGGGGTGSGPLAALGDTSPGPARVELPQLSPPGAPLAVPEVKETSPLRMILTLAAAGAIAGSVLVFVFLWSQPRILAYQAKVLAESIGEVLKGPDRYETFYVYQGRLTRELPEGVSPGGLDRIYLGYDGDGRPMGFAVSGAKAGYMDLIHVIFGYDPRSKEVLGMKVMDHRETPGLGDVIHKDEEFIEGFSGVRWPLKGIKAGTATGDPHEVDMVTGATISCRTIVDLINLRIQELEPLLEGFQWTAPREGAGTPAGGGGPAAETAGSGDGKEEAA